MKPKLLVLAVLLFFVHAAYSQTEQMPDKAGSQPDKQNRYTLSGIIRDASSGDKLIGATILSRN